LLLALLVGSTGHAGGQAPVKAAFIGDQGLGGDAEATLQLIKDEGADLIVHQGDFDYDDDPQAWDGQITSILSDDFPYFASVGNHDNCCISEYQQVLQARLDKAPEASCEGELIVQTTCTFRGLYMVFTAPDVVADGDTVYAPYIRDQLAKSDAIWKICSWHKNMSAMQVGGKDDEAGWGVYEECRKGGAFVATGHEHSYSRTHLMSSFESQTVASTSSTLVIERGKSFAFVSGLGGNSIRDQQRGGDWWAAIYTSTQGANFGALFCTFFAGAPDRASCYFKDIDGNVPDAFDLISGVIGEPVSTPTAIATPTPTPTPTAGEGGGAPIGAIVGGAVGGLFLLAVGGGWYARRRWLRR
jgi:hypothetical protein